MSKSHYSEQQRNELVLKLMTNFGNQATKENIISYCEKNGLPNPHFLISRRDIKDGKFYNLQSFNTESVEMSTEEMAPALQAQVIPLKPKRIDDEESSISVDPIPLETIPSETDPLESLPVEPVTQPSAPMEPEATTETEGNLSLTQPYNRNF